VQNSICNIVLFGLWLGTSVVRVLMYFYFRLYKNKQRKSKREECYIWPPSI